MSRRRTWPASITLTIWHAKRDSATAAAGPSPGTVLGQPEHPPMPQHQAPPSTENAKINSHRRHAFRRTAPARWARTELGGPPSGGDKRHHARTRGLRSGRAASEMTRGEAAPPCKTLAASRPAIEVKPREYGGAGRHEEQRRRAAEAVRGGGRGPDIPEGKAGRVHADDELAVRLHGHAKQPICSSMTSTRSAP